VARSTKLIYSGASGRPAPRGEEAPTEQVSKHTDPGVGPKARFARVGGLDQTLALPDGLDDDGPTVAIRQPEPATLSPEDPDGPTCIIPPDEPTHPHGTRLPSAPPSRPEDALAPADPVLRCPKCATHYSERIKFCPFDGEQLELAADWDPAEDPLIGQTVSNRYQVVGILAEGGMGTVYRVRHAKLGNLFAMKVLRSDLAEDPEVAERLIGEARATAAIGHPNIVSVSDFGEIDRALLPGLGELKLPYFVMECLDGPSLADAIRADGKLEPIRVVHIMIQVAGALEAAHKVGIIHRDLKPANVRLTSDKGGEIAKVVDFGVAKVIGGSKRTLPGQVFGTPHYMSPEQGQGQDVDLRTDVYAVGIMIFECLAGTVPFAADTYMGVVTQHMVTATPELDDAACGELPLAPVVARCLAKDPAARYGSMSDLVAELQVVLDGHEAQSQPRSGGLAPRNDEDPTSTGQMGLPVYAQRRAMWLWVAVGAMAFVVAVLAWVVVGDRLSGEGEAEPAASAVGEGTASGPVAASTDSQPAATDSVQPGEPGSSPVASATAPGSKGVGSATSAPPASTATKPPVRPPPVKPPPPKPPPRPTGDVVNPWGG